VFKGIPGPEGLSVISLKSSGAIERIVGEAMPLVMAKINETKEGKKAEAKK